MGPENKVGLGGCRIMEGLLPYFNMVTVPHNWADLGECWITEVSD